MSPSSEEYTYRISVHDFDKSLLPAHARIPGTDEFSEEVNRVLHKEYAEFGGWVQIVVNQETIQVTWKSDPTRPSPIEVVYGKLERGETVDAIRLLERLRHHEPDNIAVLCNLGMALSDAGLLDRADNCLRRAVELQPKHASALVALGVVLSRQGKLREAIEPLQTAIEADPSNSWAYRNLAAVLSQSERFTDAEPHYRKAIELNSDDMQAVLGLGRCLVHLGEKKQADALFAQVIEKDSTTSLAEEARKERTKFAQENFRAKMPVGVRSDAVMYCLGAMQKFEKMGREQVQKIGFEIAMMGQKGLDTNNPDEQYQLTTMPGRFSGLHLVCLMFVAFKIVAPEHDIHFDLGKEYEVAKSMWNDK